MAAGKWGRRLGTALATLVLAVASMAGCGAAPDDRTVITVWSWEPSMRAEARAFEKDNPDVRVDIKSTSGYDNLNSAIQDGYDLPDVVQLEYFALRQYAVSGQLRDLTDGTRGFGDAYTPGTWSSVQLNGRVYGVPMDSGPMAFFYNEDVFHQAGVDASRIRTWDDYYEAAKKLKAIGVYIAADSGDASFYNAMVWLAGGRPFKTSGDGKTVTVDLAGDKGTLRFTEFWQKMIDEGLVETRLATWSDGWKSAVASGQVASVLSGGWMPSMLLSDVPGGAGLWRVGCMPTPDGSQVNAENGGSALSVLHLTRKPNAAMRFVEYVCRDKKGIARRVDGGAFPADVATLNSEKLLTKTTIRDVHGNDIAYFGGQEFNRVLARAAENVSTGYQYLPFEVYARGDFRSTVGKAYSWQSAEQTRLRVRRQIEAGRTNADGSPLQLPDDPGPRVSLADGIALWQKDLKEYGNNQGFTIN
ncbi:multiple sugar transport system substrate-binding protein [Bifidobacterium bohemicum]|uniref:ABC transporter, solute-binding protein n=1 Tax=Bifidobacterium bohemicum DSM 22767 TaxID=1437606 RepID=A0A086ZK48_9BIFI|nr:extracellular solute-binding protein [Bifidobacterium bohemicum]KFI46898.1 ABC transporter, solute-binding protein [Bifidobacterium bohemicum DSM 22767]SCB84379.1 multiple sugar transport system substrate-binding protein [Bifidobacterium bohemicum]